MNKAALSILIFFVVFAGAVSSMQAGHKHHSKGSQQQQQPGQAAFSILALSWAPNYCDDPSKSHSASECGRHLGFVVHGLWPENADGSPAPACQGGSPLGQDVVQELLSYIPDRGLIQHEWQTHGSCQFASGQQFANAVKEAFTSLKIPDAYNAPKQNLNLGVSQIESTFAQANGTTPDSFRVSCHAGKLINLEACYSKDLKLMNCGGVRNCSGQVELDAVQ